MAQQLSLFEEPARELDPDPLFFALLPDEDAAHSIAELLPADPPAGRQVIVAQAQPFRESDWSRPWGSRYQHGLSTGSGNDGK